jgi:hypothetical protein
VRVAIVGAGVIIIRSPPVIVMKPKPRVGRIHVARFHHDHFRFRADLLHRLTHELAVLPNPFGHFSAIGFAFQRLRDSFHRRAFIIIIDDPPVVQRSVPRRLIVLVHGIADQPAKNGSRSQADEGSCRIPADRLPEQSPCAGTDERSLLGVIAIRGVMGAGKKELPPKEE